MWTRLQDGGRGGDVAKRHRRRRPPREFPSPVGVVSTICCPLSCILFHFRQTPGLAHDGVVCDNLFVSQDGGVGEQSLGRSGALAAVEPAELFDKAGNISLRYPGDLTPRNLTSGGQAAIANRLGWSVEF